MSLTKRTYDDYIWGLKFRPQKIEHLIAPERIRSTLKRIIDSGNVGCLMLSGPPGVGKTTMAFLIGELLDMETLYINASIETGIDVVRTKMTNFVTTKSWDGRRKLIIGDEIERFTQNSQDGLKAFIEEFSKSCNFIFTTNHISKVIEPLQSRSQCIDFNLSKSETEECKKLFFKMCGFYLKQEGVEFDKKVVAKVVSRHFPDMRRSLNQLQAANNSGILQDIERYEEAANTDIQTFYKLLKEKDFTGIRQYVSNIGDVAGFYRMVYDTFLEHVETDSIAGAIMLIAEYDYKRAMSVDPQINMTAFATSMMVDIEMKKGV